jgi:hypothetical protein
MGTRSVLVAVWMAAAAAPAGTAVAAPVTAEDERALDALLGSLVAGAAPEANGASAADAGREALSVFEREGEACAWVRVELPGGARRKLAELPFSCDGLHAARGPSGDAVLWRSGRGAALTLVDERGRSSELPLPRRGSVERVGYASDGALFALTASAIRLMEDDEGAYVRYRGKRVGFEHVPRIGTMLLAHAYRWDGARWTEIETAATSGSACDTLGVDALASAREIEPRAGQSFVDETDELHPGPALQALADPGDGAWRGLRVAAGKAAAWFTAPGGMLVETGLVVAEVDGQERVLETGLGPDDSVTLEVRGPYVLVDGGQGTRVFDARDGKLVFETAANTSFWPGPRQARAQVAGPG